MPTIAFSPWGRIGELSLINRVCDGNAQSQADWIIHIFQLAAVTQLFGAFFERKATFQEAQAPLTTARQRRPPGAASDHS
jgi:hypothetical protein